MTLWKQIKFALSKPPRAQIKFIVTTYIGNNISQRFYGKSLVGNFLQLLYVQMANNDSANFVASGAPWSSVSQAKDTGNVNRTLYNILIWPVKSIGGSVNSGLICGSGTTTVTASDYKIETLIAHGNSASQLNYQAQTSSQGCEIVSLTTSFVLQRLFVNNSGGQINVNEIALYCTGSGYIICLYRDVLGVTDEIPDGETYRVTLEISVTS